MWTLTDDNYPNFIPFCDQGANTLAEHIGGCTGALSMCFFLLNNKCPFIRFLFQRPHLS